VLIAVTTLPCTLIGKYFLQDIYLLRNIVHSLILGSLAATNMDESRSTWHLKVRDLAIISSLLPEASPFFLIAFYWVSIVLSGAEEDENLRKTEQLDDTVSL
jgi:hypothetical protein